MAGYALPGSEVENPCIGKASDVIVAPSLICALGMVNAGDYGGIAEEIDLHILDVCHGGLEKRVFDIGQEFLLIADFAVPLGVYESAGDQRVQCRGVAIDLRFIPQMLQHHEIVLASIGLLGCGYSETDCD